MWVVVLISVIKNELQSRGVQYRSMRLFPSTSPRSSLILLLVELQGGTLIKS